MTNQLNEDVKALRVHGEYSIWTRQEKGIITRVLDALEKRTAYLTALGVQMQSDDEKFLDEIESANNAFKYYHTEPEHLANGNEPYVNTVGPTIERLIRMVRERDEKIKELLKGDAYMCEAHNRMARGIGDLEAKLGKATEALKVIDYCNRSRGYPTGTEWMELATMVHQCLEEISK